MRIKSLLVSIITIAAGIGIWPGIIWAKGLPADTKLQTASTAKPAAQPAEEDEDSTHYNTIILQGLNKVTGHISKLDGPIGTVMRFGNLEIVARRCWKSSPEEQPENAALLEIRELQPDEGSKRIFLGWMFSSSPGLSGLEHAVYDINVLSCEYRADPEKKDSSSDNKDTASGTKTAAGAKKDATKRKKTNKDN